MARSYLKTPVFGNAKARSDKADKQKAHRVVRAQFRTQLASSPDLESFEFDGSNEAHSNVWDFAKDGKHYSLVRVAVRGRSLKVLSAPWYLKSDRDVHKAMGK